MQIGVRSGEQAKGRGPGNMKTRKILISLFQQFFASIGKGFILGGGLGTRL